MYPTTQGKILPLLVHNYLVIRIIHPNILSHKNVLTNKNRNFTPSQNEILKWNFVFDYIELQKFNSTGNVKKQGITKVIYNCDIKRRAVCEFVKDNL